MENTLTLYEQICIQQADRTFYLGVFALIVAFVSACVVYLDYRHKKSKEHAEKSILIAKQFSDDIIERISIIVELFKKNDIEPIIQKIKFTKLNNFNCDELNELYSSEDIRNYKEKLSSLSIKTNNNEINARKYITQTLNTLEYVSMYISTNVADEKYIYNSLHDLFFTITHLLYICIATTNEDCKNLYYSNLIFVFNLWKDRYIKSSIKEKKALEKIKYKMRKIK